MSMKFIPGNARSVSKTDSNATNDHDPRPISREHTSAGTRTVNRSKSTSKGGGSQNVANTKSIPIASNPSEKLTKLNSPITTAQTNDVRYSVHGSTSRNPLSKNVAKSAPQHTPSPIRTSASNNSIFPSPASSSNADIINCCCCGTLLLYNTNKKDISNSKFKCSICKTTNILDQIQKDTEVPHVLTYDYIRGFVDSCLKKSDDSKSIHEIFNPLSNYLYLAFKNLICVNNSFKINPSSKHNHYSTSNINYSDIQKSFTLLLKLPTKKPLYRALCGCIELLKRVHVFTNNDDPRNLLWLLILLEIPFLNQSLIIAKSDELLPEIKELCYEILKRSIGILSNSITPISINYIASWFSRLSSSAFTNKIDILNHYITFHLKKHYHLALNPLISRNPSYSAPHSRRHTIDTEYIDQVALKQQMNEIAAKSSKSKPKVKITIHQYGNDWHIKSAANCLVLFVKANSIRNPKVPANSFYNSLVDFVDIKLDFDSWQKNSKQQIRGSNSEPNLESVIEYIHGNSGKRTLNESASFYFCQYPFLISLGGKILISEYEAKRQMERKAEEAFINSLDKRVVIDVYFQVAIRRSHIIQDSLRVIKSNKDNLKKTLRVKFIGEPGIDAGGLKKEWFLLLTRKLFSPSTGMFINSEDSNLLWFNMKPPENEEMYYLFGAVLGLAIYNSTILDLQFPRALYKILLGQTIAIEDFKQLDPIAYQNLVKLREMLAEQLKDLDLTFEVNFQDIFSKNYCEELIPQGKQIAVNEKNVQVYIEKYYNFFMYDGIRTQIQALKLGFTNVVGGNGLSLYSAEEIELLLCGDNSQIDIEILKSITKYYGWITTEVAIKSTIIKWFWRYLQHLTVLQQRKFLIFVTGSDRVPATGIQNLNFRISLIGNDSNMLPMAHTCFNELELYDYSSYEKLTEKLNYAVNEASEFGIK